MSQALEVQATIQFLRSFPRLTRVSLCLPRRASLRRPTAATGLAQQSQAGPANFFPTEATNLPQAVIRYIGRELRALESICLTVSHDDESERGGVFFVGSRMDDGTLEVIRTHRRDLSPDHWPLGMNDDRI